MASSTPLRFGRKMELKYLLRFFFSSSEKCENLGENSTRLYLFIYLFILLHLHSFIHTLLKKQHLLNNPLSFSGVICCFVYYHMESLERVTLCEPCRCVRRFSPSPWAMADTLRGGRSNYIQHGLEGYILFFPLTKQIKQNLLRTFVIFQSNFDDSHHNSSLGAVAL